MENLQTFQNPDGYWSHDGAFSVELTPDADKNIAPSTAEIRGDIVHVKNGHIKQNPGAIQFVSEGKPFYWGYKWIKVIRDGGGNILWVNQDHR